MRVVWLVSGARSMLGCAVSTLACAVALLGLWSLGSSVAAADEPTSKRREVVDDSGASAQPKAERRRVLPVEGEALRPLEEDASAAPVGDPTADHASRTLGLGTGEELSGLISREGIEVRADQRVYTLFALFNALGYDRESTRGARPLAAPQYDALREAVRHQLATSAFDLGPARAYVQGHPDELAAYVRQVVRLGPAPDFAAPSAPDRAELAALGQVLERFHHEVAGRLFEEQREAMRAIAKDWIVALDKATDRSREIVRMSEDESVELDLELTEGDTASERSRIIVVVNPLDTHGAVYVAERPGERFVVFGPTEVLAQSVDAVVLDFQRDLIAPCLQRALARFDPAKLQAALRTRMGNGGSPEQQLIGEALAVTLASRTLQRPLSGAFVPAVPAPLGKAAEQAITWFGSQQGSFAELAPGVVGQLLGIEAPPQQDPKGGS